MGDGARFVLGRGSFALALGLSMLAGLAAGTTSVAAAAGLDFNISQPSFVVNPSNSGYQASFWANQSNNTVEESWYTPSAGWSGPKDLGWRSDSTVSAAEANDGTQYLFWEDDIGQIDEAYYDSGWHWNPYLWYTDSAPAVGVNPSNDDLFVFWQGTDGDLNEAWNNGGSTWDTKDFGSGWGMDSAPTVGVNDAGHQYVFWTGSNGDVWEAYYNAGWHGPQDQGWAAASAPSASVDPSNDDENVLWKDSGGDVKESSWAGSTWSTPQEIGTGFATVGAPSSATDDANDQWAAWEDPTSGHVDQSNCSSCGSPSGWVSPIDMSWSTTLPLITTSIYEHNTVASDLYSQGEDAGEAGANGVVILDFGQPDQCGSDYGDYDYSDECVAFDATYDSRPSIVSAMEQYVDGYAAKAPPGDGIYVSLGSNNGDGSGIDFTSWGKSMGDAVGDVATYLGNTGTLWETISASAGLDAEADYGTYPETQDMVTGFGDTTDGEYLFDDGSAYLSNGWTYGDIYKVAYGSNFNFPVPEIYEATSPTLPWEWAQVSSAGTYPMAFFSVATENGYDGEYSAATSYSDMVSELVSCQCSENYVSGGVGPIPYLSYIQPD